MTGEYPGFSWADATSDDAETLSRLFIAGWRQAYAEQMPQDLLAGLETNPNHNPASWRRRLARRPPDRWTRIVRTDAGEPVGFVWFGAEEGRVEGYRGEVEKIYLLKPWQGRGLGRAMMADAFQTLEGVGLWPALVWVFDFNRPARDFYARLGGRLLGRTETVFEAQGHPYRETVYGWPPDGLAPPATRR